MDSSSVPRNVPGAAVVHVGPGALFEGFMRVGLSGFGGVLPFARRMVVEQREWLTEEEFNEVLSLSQFLPGPNIVNVSIIIGRRFSGVMGALAATFGLMLMPMIIVLLLATVYARFAQIDTVRHAAYGVSAGAAGLVLSTGFKMARAIRGSPWQIGVAIIAFAAIGVARLPLLWVIAVMAPVSLAIAWRTRR